VERREGSEDSSLANATLRQQNSDPLEGVVHGRLRPKVSSTWELMLVLAASGGSRNGTRKSSPIVCG